MNINGDGSQSRSICESLAVQLYNRQKRPDVNKPARILPVLGVIWVDLDPLVGAEVSTRLQRCQEGNGGFASL